MSVEAALWGVAMTGTITSIIQNASGFPLLRRVAEEKDSSKYSKIPMITMTATTLMIGLYGVYVVKRADLVICNAVGAIFWLINFLVFFWYAPTPRAKLLLTLAYGGIVLFSVLIYVLFWEWLDETSVPARATIVAAIMQTFNISGFASPFRSIYFAVKELDTRRVPRLLSFVNVINSTLWTTYGGLIEDPWILGPNVAGVVLAAIQVGALVYIELQKSKQNRIESSGEKSDEETLMKQKHMGGEADMKQTSSSNGGSSSSSNSNGVTSMGKTVEIAVQPTDSQAAL